MAELDNTLLFFLHEQTSKNKPQGTERVNIKTGEKFTAGQVKYKQERGARLVNTEMKSKDKKKEARDNIGGRQARPRPSKT